MSTTTRRLCTYKNVLPATTKSKFERLLVSGCSFTDQVKYEENLPLSWPAYMACRCNIPELIDLSNTAAGNEYISTSIVNEVENYNNFDLQKTLILVMWSGLDRLEYLSYDKNNVHKDDDRGIIDKIRFDRAICSIELSQQSVQIAESLRSWKNIILLENYLKAKKANFAFSFYVNIFDYPFIPRLDQSPNAPDVFDKNKLQKLLNCSWLHKHQHSLYEHCFKRNLLSDDLFHPSPEGYLNWTDNVLLPSLEKNNFVTKLC